MYSCLYAAHQRNRAVLLLVIEEERTVRKPADKVIAPVLLDNPVLSHSDIIPKTRLLYQFYCINKLTPTRFFDPLRYFVMKTYAMTHIAPHFHFMHTVKAAEPESIRQPAQRRQKKRQRPDFDAPVFRLSALARVIRTQAAKKKGRKIDVDPAFPPEIRGVSDADLASTSAESPPARRPCVHQSQKWDKGGYPLQIIGNCYLQNAASVTDHLIDLTQCGIITAMKFESCADRTMKISAKARYALRIVLDVAVNTADGVLRRGQEIARAQNISEKFLSRLVIPLRQKGILSSVRGAAGGFRLACKPDKIRLLDIIQSVQGTFAILDCLKPGAKCPKECSCLVKKVWGEINNAFMETLSRHTIASILKQKRATLDIIGC